MGNHRTSLEKFKQQLYNKWGSSVSIYPETYTKASNKAKFKHVEYGDFWSTPKECIRKRATYPCKEIGSLAYKKLYISPVNELVLKLPQHISIDESTYKGVAKKVKFIDSKYGEFWALPANIIKGGNHPKRSRLSQIDKISIPLVEIKRRLYEKLGDDVILIDSTYKGLVYRAKFIDSMFGEYSAIANNVISHGNRHPKYAAVKQNRSAVLQNWETGENIVTVGSYELAAANYLNANKIRYIWHPKTFETPFNKAVKSGFKTYTPDLYLIDQDLWVEIKGRFIDDAEDKWNWFHATHTNSVLWNKEKLKEMGIL